MAHRFPRWVYDHGDEPDARFTLANYVHVNDEDLAAGAVALGELYRKAL